MSATVRQARESDDADIIAFTEGTWADRDVDDYIPDVFREWVRGDGPDQRTFVADVDGRVVGLCQGVLLTETEAWAQGMRVDPEFRGEGISTVLTDACADWARERGATVMRNMVFGWNTAGLGASRGAAFDPATEFRWAHPTPDATASLDGEHAVTVDPAAGWQFWQASDAADHLCGLGLDMDESWALSAVTRDRFRRAAEEQTQLTITRASACATTYRVRSYERDEGGETVRWAEYGVGAWADPASARALLAAISNDAARLDVDRVRVLIPETARFVSDAVAAVGEVSDHPDFVMTRDLTET